MGEGEARTKEHACGAAWPQCLRRVPAARPGQRLLPGHPAGSALGRDRARARQVKGLELGGVSVEEARALGRPPMGYVREELRDRLAGEISRLYLRWLHPTSRRRSD